MIPSNQTLEIAATARMADRRREAEQHRLIQPARQDAAGNTTVGGVTMHHIRDRALRQRANEVEYRLPMIVSIVQVCPSTNW